LIRKVIPAPKKDHGRQKPLKEQVGARLGGVRITVLKGRVRLQKRE